MTRNLFDYYHGLIEQREIRDKIARGELTEEDEDAHMDKMDDLWWELTVEETNFLKVAGEKMSIPENLPDNFEDWEFFDPNNNVE